MAKVTALQQAILDLSDGEFTDLVRWLRDLDWERWEQEFDRDVQAGKLDSFGNEALESRAKGDTKIL